MAGGYFPPNYKQAEVELNDILNLLLYLEQEQERRVNMREKTRTRSSRGAYRSIRQAGSHVDVRIKAA